MEMRKQRHPSDCPIQPCSLHLHFSLTHAFHAICMCTVSFGPQRMNLKWPLEGNCLRKKLIRVPGEERFLVRIGVLIAGEEWTIGPSPPNKSEGAGLGTRCTAATASFSALRISAATALAIRAADVCLHDMPCPYDHSNH